MARSNKPGEARRKEWQMRLSESTVAALGRVAKTRDQLRMGREVLKRQVIEARGAGASWDAIGRMLGTTGEAARKTYGPRVTAALAPKPDALW